jgi:hypothetical protein
MARGLPLSENRFLEDECPRCEAMKVRFIPTKPGFYWMKDGEMDPQVVWIEGPDLLIYRTGSDDPDGLDWVSKDEKILWASVEAPVFKKVFPPESFPIQQVRDV